MPAGARLTSRRPTLPRLLLVHGLVTAGVWLATWRYVIHDGDANGATAVIGVLLGVLWSASQFATYRQSGSWAEQLHDNIDELRTRRAELRQLLDDLPDAVVVLGRDGRIRELNANTVELTGRHRDDLLGRYLIELFDDGDRTRLVDLWRMLRQGSDMVTPTLPFVRPDGTTVLLEADANLPLRDPDRVVIALRDVTAARGRGAPAGEGPRALPARVPRRAHRHGAVDRRRAAC